MGLDNDEPVASDEEVAILRRIRAQRENKHVLAPNPAMRSRAESLCRCQPGHCLLHPSLTTCSLREGSNMERNS